MRFENRINDEFSKVISGCESRLWEKNKDWRIGVLEYRNDEKESRVSETYSLE